MGKMDLQVQWKELMNRTQSIMDKKMSEELKKYLNLYKDKLIIAPGAATHHHNYDGGLLEHTLEVVDIAREMYYTLTVNFKQSISFDEIVFCAIIHDIGKINQYYKDRDGVWRFKKPYMQHSTWVIVDWFRKTNFILDLRIVNAILSHHGGWSRTESEVSDVLSAVLHSADLISSRFDKKSRSNV
jgi:23S rRNA maturation-related 3'-5' exoribonuclease YhaM